MSTERFGESFQLDFTSRVEILKKEEEMPEYVDFSRRLRSLLKDSVAGENSADRSQWPECPKNLTNVEDLLTAAKEAVTEKWQEVAPELLEKTYQEWLGKIPDNEENQDIRKLLQNPQALDEKIKTQQLGELEGLRNILPDAWRTLVLTVSERQLATLTLLRHWVKTGLSDEDAIKLGASKTELGVMLDAGGILGKYADHAFVKQIELADQPGGSAETKLGQTQGAEYLYDLYKSPDSDQLDLKTYAEVFKGEWPKIIHGLEILSKKISTLVAENKLPQTYQTFPAYLDQLVNLYGSDVTSPEKLKEMWGEINQKMEEVARAGCPLMIIPGFTPSVAGEANKIDIDLRLGIRTEGIFELENSLEEFRNEAQEIVKLHQDKLTDKNYQVPKMILNTQPFAFGGNLQLYTPAETGEGRMVSHVNVNNELAKISFLPLIKKLLPAEYSGLNEEEFLKTVNVDTALHEMGHNIMPTEDKAVFKRIGSSAQANVLEELKAESAGMLLLKQKLEKLPKDEAGKMAQKFLLTKLATVCDYLATNTSEPGSEGERYYLTGQTIIGALLKENVLVEENGHYNIADAQKGIEIISQIGQEILDKFYFNEQAKPQDVKNYIKELKQRKNDPVLKKFIKNIKN